LLPGVPSNHIASTASIFVANLLSSAFQMIWEKRARRMGSSLSGRRNGKPLVEDCISIDLARVMRLGPIRGGQAGSGELHWSIEGQRIVSIKFRLDLRDTEKPLLMLLFSAPDGRPSRQTITLTATPQRLGGSRWWMVCPEMGKRVRTLHLAPGRDRFASREALGLAYRVERMDQFDRSFEKLFRVQRRLGQPQGLAFGLERPKGMWRHTFNRHLAALERHENASVNQIAALIAKA
jgi:hypothetical protein